MGIGESMRSAHLHNQQHNRHRFGARKRFAVWLCAFALVLQGLMPVLVSSAQAATDTPGSSANAAVSAFGGPLYICTAYGLQPLAQGQDQQTPLDGVPGLGHGSCPLCQIHNLHVAITPPLAVVPVHTVTSEPLEPPTYRYAALSGHAQRPDQPRAPPAFS